MKPCTQSDTHLCNLRLYLIARQGGFAAQTLKFGSGTRLLADGVGNHVGLVRVVIQNLRIVVGDQHEAKITFGILAK